MNKKIIVGSKEKPVLLNKTLESLVDKFVQNYKSDLKIDFNEIIETKNLSYRKKMNLSFIWFLRANGTQLMFEDFIKVKKCGENTLFNYWKEEAIKVYRITVTKACKVSIYGFIEEINMKKYKEEVLKLEKESENIEFEVVKKDNSRIILNERFEEGFYIKSLNKAKVNSEDVKKVNYIRYY